MIVFIQKKNKNITIAKFKKELDKVLEYWDGVGTVRKFKDTLFIQNISFPHTVELMRKWGMSFQVRTEL